MGGISIYLSYDRELDWLMAYEFGRVDDYHLPGAWHGVSESFGFMLSEPGGEEVGFKVLGFSEFDADGEAVTAIWTGPRFDVPALGLREVSAGEIVTAAVPFLDGESTVNRRLFHHAMDARDEVAVALWRDCLQSGDPMANYGLGCTLFELGRHREAYRYLRAYTEIVPANPWAWCWLGRACHALGETAEARSCYERALEFEDDDEATDAAELLALLAAGSAPVLEDESGGHAFQGESPSPGSLAPYDPSMEPKWTADQTGHALPDEFEQMYQVGLLPVGPDWFAQQGITMHATEVEPQQFPVELGTVRTDRGPFMVEGAPGDDAVALWALKELTPREAVDYFAAALGHGATPLHVTPREDGIDAPAGDAEGSVG